MTNQDAPDLQLAAATTVTETPTPASTKPSETQALQNYAIPGSVRLKYEVRVKKRHSRICQWRASVEFRTARPTKPAWKSAS